MEQALEANVGIKRKTRLDKLGYNSDSDEDNVTYRERVEREENDGLFGDEASENEANDEAVKRPLNPLLVPDDGDPDGIVDPEVHYSDNSQESDDPDFAEEHEQQRMRYYLDQESDNHQKTLLDPKLEKFNLDDERETGRFDENANYVENEGSDNEIQDSWLKGVDRKAIKQAKVAQQRQEDARAKNSKRDSLSKHELLDSLAGELQRGESAQEALGHLNKIRKTDKGAKAKIERITEFCNELLDGDMSIYERSREELAREYSRITGKPWASSDLKRKRDEQEVDQMWEFQWNEDEEIQGPFTSKQMTEWLRYDYFDDNVLVREAGTDEPFKSIKNVF